MLPLTVVIVAKNEAHQIAACIKPWLGVTDDILVADNGSTDGMADVARAAGARVIQVVWQGYSATKNEANRQARYNWILSLDADEVANPELLAAVQQLFQTEPKSSQAFALRRRLVYLGKTLRHGAVASEYRLRLFHRSVGSWNGQDVHEDIQFSLPVTVTRLNGFLWHYSCTDEADHLARLEKYAQLFAHQQKALGRKAIWLKAWLSPCFGFVKNYVFKGGFLDGQAGYRFARNEMRYTQRKYALLQELNQASL